MQIKKNRNGFIYLLRERASVNIDEEVYKTGKTKNIKKRLAGYTKGYEIKHITLSKNIDIDEKEIFKKYNEKFNKRKDYGREYFEGNVNEMIKIINKTVKNNI